MSVRRQIGLKGREAALCFVGGVERCYDCVVRRSVLVWIVFGSRDGRAVECMTRQSSGCSSESAKIGLLTHDKCKRESTRHKKGEAMHAEQRSRGEPARRAGVEAFENVERMLGQGARYVANGSGSH